MLRKLISVAGEITGYFPSRTTSPGARRGGTKVFRWPRIAWWTPPAGRPAAAGDDKLRGDVQRGGTITGTATGYDDLTILSGLSPAPSYRRCPAGDGQVSRGHPVMDPTTGAVRTAAEWFDEACAGRPIHVLSLDGDGRMGPARRRRPSTTAASRCSPAVPILPSLADLQPSAVEPAAGNRSANGRRRRHHQCRQRCQSSAPQPFPMPTSTFWHWPVAASTHTTSGARCGDHGSRHQVVRFLIASSPPTAPRGLHGEHARIGYASVSGLAADRHLLLRFGIRSKLRTRSIAYAGGRRTSYEVEVMGASSLLRFAEEIGSRQGGGCGAGRRSRVSEWGFHRRLVADGCLGRRQKARATGRAAINTQASKPFPQLASLPARPRRRPSLLADV